MTVKYIMIFVFLFFACGLQQKPEISCFNTQPNQVHSHDNDHTIKVGDFFEFLLTGNFEHTHSHHDQNEEEAHEHPHQHSSVVSVAFADYIPEIFHFNFENFKL